jgi:hypothetical protein
MFCFKFFGQEKAEKKQMSLLIDGLLQSFHLRGWENSAVRNTRLLNNYFPIARFGKQKILLTLNDEISDRSRYDEVEAIRTLFFMLILLSTRNFIPKAFQEVTNDIVFALTLLLMGMKVVGRHVLKPKNDWLVIELKHLRDWIQDHCENDADNAVAHEHEHAHVNG